MDADGVTTPPASPLTLAWKLALVLAQVLALQSTSKSPLSLSRSSHADSMFQQRNVTTCEMLMHQTDGRNGKDLGVYFLGLHKGRVESGLDSTSE